MALEIFAANRSTFGFKIERSHCRKWEIYLLLPFSNRYFSLPPVGRPQTKRTHTVGEFALYVAAKCCEDGDTLFWQGTRAGTTVLRVDVRKSVNIQMPVAVVYTARLARLLVRRSHEAAVARRSRHEETRSVAWLAHALRVCTPPYAASLWRQCAG